MDPSLALMVPTVFTITFNVKLVGADGATGEKSLLDGETYELLLGGC